MKLHKLHLKAFGPFTDISLDFSGGARGLHIVYGPNEAGKSSSLRAITAFLYGFPRTTPDNFLYEYKKLRVGAEVSNGSGEVLQLLRRKAAKTTLFDSADQEPVDESILEKLLGKVDEPRFAAMFGINHDILRQGGEGLVRGKGHMGEALFSAGAGLVDLHQMQTSLAGEVESLFKTSGRSGKVVEGIREYQEQKKLLKDLQASADVWKLRKEALDRSEQNLKRLKQEISRKRSRKERLQRIQNAVKANDRWRKAAADLQGLKAIPCLPADFEKTVQKHLQELTISEQLMQTTASERKKVENELSQLVIPADLLYESEAIELLRERLGSHRKAQADRSLIETERKIAESEAQDILKRLGRAPDLSGVEALRLPENQIVHIRDLGTKKEGLVEKLASAQQNCERIRGDIKKTRQKQKPIEASPAQAELISALQELRKEGDILSQLSALKKSTQAERRQAEVDLQKLPLFHGGLEEVETLAVPPNSTIDRFDAELHAVAAELQSLQKSQAKLAEEGEKLKRQLTRLESQQKVPTLQELEEARRQRQRGWGLVLAAWQDQKTAGEEIAAFLKESSSPTTGLADAYQQAVEKADQVADLLHRDAERVAKKEQIQSAQQQNAEEIAGLGEAIAQARAEQARLEKEWQDRWPVLAAPALSPLEMRDWLRKQQELAERVQNIRKSEMAAAALEQRVKELCLQLATALKKTTLAGSIENLSLSQLEQRAESQVEAALKERSHQEQLAADLEKFQGDLTAAETQFQKSQRALEEWETAWTKEMKRLQLSDDATPLRANNVLSDISNLFQQFQTAEKCRVRIEGIQNDAQAFTADVAALAKRIATDLAASAPEETVVALARRLKEAETAVQQQKSLSARLCELKEKLQLAEKKTGVTTALLQSMCQQANCLHHHELLPLAEQSRRRQQLEAEAADAQGQILDQCGGQDFDAFVAEVENEDADSIAPQIEELDSELQLLEDKKEQCITQIEQDRHELARFDGGSVAQAQAAHCESIASRLENELRRLAALRVAAAVLAQGIEKHREKNQGPLLTQASKLFQRLTLGTFIGLKADYNEKGEAVVAGIRGEDETLVYVEGMSEGTRDQLYLSLRLASLETWISADSHVPFIVDDLFLNFDDQRAAAGLQILAELSQKTQVIFFTHHQHLVELAEQHISPEQLFVQTLGETA